MLDPVFLKQALASASLVAPMAVLTVGGLWVGSELDARFESSPWATFGLGAMGFGAGLLQLFRGLSRLQEPNVPPPPDRP